MSTFDAGTAPRAIVFAAALVSAAGGAADAQAGEDAATVIARMTQAHGGLERWRNAPTVSFTDSWTTPGGEVKRASVVIVEQGRRRSLMTYDGGERKIGWDGDQCWSLNWDSPAPPRFFVMLTYYFVNLPWVVHDPGVVLHEPVTTKLWDDPTEYISVRVTYEENVGDTPDDYYVLYIHPDSYELAGCEYVVTYPTLLPEGATSTPAHTLMFDELITVDELKVPASFTIYNADHSVYAACELTGWSFTKPFDPALVVAPDGAVVDESMDG